MSETHFEGSDMAHIIEALRPELGDQFQDHYPAVVRRMTDIVANPSKPVNLRTADAIVTAMGCPHMLANGAVRVVEHSRKGAGNHPAAVAVPANGNVPGILLPAAPFRKWMERQSRHYRTLTSMYHDFDLTPKQGAAIWRGDTKKVHSHVVEVAAARRGVHIGKIYPQLAR